MEKRKKKEKQKIAVRRERTYPILSYPTKTCKNEEKKKKGGIFKFFLGIGQPAKGGSGINLG